MDPTRPEQPEPTPSFDLAALIKPVTFEAPGLGRLQVDAADRDFLDWVADTAEGGGVALARRLLAERAARADSADDSAGAVSPEAAEGLTIEALDEAADAFIDASGALFRPGYTEETRPGRRAPRVRKRRPDERYDLARGPDERGTDRLLRVLRAAVQDRAHRARFFAQSFEESPTAEAVRAAVKSVSATSELQRQWAELPSRKLSGIYGDLASERLAKLAGPPSMLRSPDLFAESGVLRALRLAAQQSAAMRAVAEPISVLRDFDRRLGLARLWPAAALDGLSPTPRPSLLTGSLYEGIVAAARATRSAELRPGVSATRSWLEEANRTLRLGLPTATLATIAALSADPGTVRSLGPDALTYLRPGWQAAAALGVAERSMRGAVAALLSRYDDYDADGDEVFNLAVDTAHAVDDADESLLDRLLALLRGGSDAYEARRLGSQDALERHGHGFNIALLLSLIGVLLTAGNYWPALETLSVAREGATSVDIQEATEAQFAAIRDQAAQDRAADWDAELRFRKVSRPTWLRSAPDAEAPVMQQIEPDEVIRVVDEQGDWLKVEAFGYADGAISTGWLDRSVIQHR